MSIRAAAFCGEFICMFASLSLREVSNHGYRFYIEPGKELRLSSERFELEEVVKKSWETEILFGDNLPAYLEKSVSVESVSDSRLIIPKAIYSDIKKISSRVSVAIRDIDLQKIEEFTDNSLR
jgi:hypothetical protein